MKVLINDNHVFHILNDVPQYLMGMEIWRIMWNGSKMRVILRGCGESYEWLHDFPEGCTLELTCTECGNPDDYNNHETLYRFENCRENRRWVPQPVVVDPNERMVLAAWVEIKCEIDFVYGKIGRSNRSTKTEIADVDRRVFCDTK